MIGSPRSPYQDPEFLRSRIIIPYDYETQVLAERQDEARARYLFALRIIAARRRTVALRILAALAFSVCAGAAIFAGACM